MASSRIKHGKIQFVNVNRGGTKSYTQGQGIKLSMFSNKELLERAEHHQQPKIRVKLYNELLHKRGIELNSYIAERDAKVAVETEALAE